MKLGSPARKFYRFTREQDLPHGPHLPLSRLAVQPFLCPPGRRRHTALRQDLAGIAARLQGRYKVALELVERAEKIFREKCTGVQWELASCAVFTVEILSWTGEISTWPFTLD